MKQLQEWWLVGALMLAACTDSTSPPAAAKLSFTVQPSDAMVGVAISPAVTVAIQDASGKTVRSATDVVSLAISTGPDGATLLGATAANAVNGVATFRDLAVGQVSARYTLTATSGNLLGASSVPFAIATIVARVRVSPSPLQIVVGAQQSMSARPVDVDGTPLPVSCTWSSSVASVAPISSGGLLSAVAPGTTMIRATCGGTTGEATVTVVPVPSRLVFATVSAGNATTCGVTTGGVTYCWGQNLYGQLGGGAEGAGGSVTPVQVSGAVTFATVSVYRRTCGVTNQGVAYCWGLNSFGELGTGTTAPYNPQPAAVSGGLTFASVSTGQYHTCGLTTRGAAYCWGLGEQGELGTGNTASSGTPLAVVGGLTFVMVAAGGWGHSCGLTTSGAAYCWGDNTFGQLGDGTTTGPQRCNPGVESTGGPCSTEPVAVSGGLTFAQISVGLAHVCGVTTGGAAYCWGWNGAGALGTGDTITSASPVAVAGGLTFAMVSAGDRYTCGVSTGGAAYCWGYNGPHLGHGSVVNADAVLAPVAVAGGLTFVMVSAGEGEGIDHTCGVTTNGVAYCWGFDSWGQLGDGTVRGESENIYSAVPVRVAYQP
jgi:alpha-tubulin suppressor-like RCC1 family protein